MKKTLLFVIAFISIAPKIFSQTDTAKAPYEKVPVFPPVRLVLPDKSAFYKKDLPSKKPVMLMVFNPQCEHCQHETDEMLKHMDWFKNTTIVMATSMPYDSMMNFRERYNLATHSNIILGQDDQYFLYSFYAIRNLPFIAFYDKKGKLISVSRGTMPIDKVAAELKKQGN
ncbi:MAG TPA: redoxin domain-containing protein [Chitinophagaceae bacterium]|nr:redoxin domain-containing protein [Chitinophagaceae bacterium]HNA18542.1 redoxin domain-containing protein [Chitinophagaceae bacterium]HNA92129.1 redoxin domain-containing protein [Chitinophagaceae bacterium]HNF37297.1 redoxin domain-containing protein [Chitinophagaceae bacterium]HNF46021.1 redoxin domain-containing protein [Chitinophagaceae bacterium]